MKKFSTILILLSIFTVAIQAQDLSKILNDFYRANGKENLSRIKNITVKGKVFQMGTEFNFTKINVLPDKFYLEVNIIGQKFIQTFNGTDGWIIAPWTGSSAPQDIPADQMKFMKREADFEGVLYNYEKKGIKLEYEGLEKVEGLDTYKIKAIYNDGDEIINFISVESLMILKTEAMLPTAAGEKDLTETFLSNYNMIDGIAVAFNIETKSNGQLSGKITIDTVGFNNEIDAALFNRPLN